MAFTVTKLDVLIVGEIQKENVNGVAENSLRLNVTNYSAPTNVEWITIIKGEKNVCLYQK